MGPRVPDYSQGAVLGRILPNGDVEVIGEVIGEVEWRKEVARRELEAIRDGKEYDDGVDPVG